MLHGQLQATQRGRPTDRVWTRWDLTQAQDGVCDGHSAGSGEDTETAGQLSSSLYMDGETEAQRGSACLSSLSC